MRNNVHEIEFGGGDNVNGVVERASASDSEAEGPTAIGGDAIGTAGDGERPRGSPVNATAQVEIRFTRGDRTTRSREAPHEHEAIGRGC